MDESRAEVYSNLSRVLMRLSESVASVAAADVALQLAERLRLDRVVAETLNNKGSSLGQTGRRREAMALLRGAVEVARAGGHVAAEIRALANMASGIEDNVESEQVNRQAFDLAMRVGNVNLARWSRESIRFAAFLRAESWDEPMAETWADVDALFGGGASLSDEARWINTSVTIRIHRGQPTTELLARLDEIAAEVSDPIVTSEVLSHQASLALVAGDYAAAARLELAAADQGSQVTFIYLSFAIRALLLAGDLEGAKATEVRHTKESQGNRIDQALGVGSEAGIAALEGRVEDAVAGYRAALERLDAIHMGWLTALLGFEFVALVGDHPAAREAAARSREIFERVGARPWLDKLDAVLASVSAAPARPAAPRATAGTEPRRIEVPWA